MRESEPVSLLECRGRRVGGKDQGPAQSMLETVFSGPEREAKVVVPQHRGCVGGAQDSKEELTEQLWP